ncbi:MAG: hypothetical protein PUC12_17830 [Clostridiales bacterium]|nr:hypothetical protein [Clostridiales bacterium]
MSENALLLEIMRKEFQQVAGVVLVIVVDMGEGWFNHCASPPFDDRSGALKLTWIFSSRSTSEKEKRSFLGQLRFSLYLCS